MFIMIFFIKYLHRVTGFVMLKLSSNKQEYEYIHFKDFTLHIQSYTHTVYSCK